MAFETFFGVAVPTPVGQIIRPYLIRKAQNQISLMDLRTPSDGWCIYGCHAFTGAEDQHRTLRKKLNRIKVFGTGAIDPDTPGIVQDRTDSVPSGVMVVITDDTRTDNYIYSTLASLSSENCLWAQGLLHTVGRKFEIEVYLQGFDIRPTEVTLEYTVVG